MMTFIDLPAREDVSVAIRNAQLATRQRNAVTDPAPATLEAVFAAAEPLPTEDWHLPQLPLTDYYV